MPYTLENKLVIGIASSALFDLRQSDKYFRKHGEEKYRSYQKKRLYETLKPGVAFNFIKRLLQLNALSTPENPFVEVIVLSRNDPETGLRVLQSVADHKLSISRAIFTQGKSPYNYIPALNISLFLSANTEDVKDATRLGFPAGRVIGNPAPEEDGEELLVAFDFDGVIADDSAEKNFQEKGMESFHKSEAENADKSLNLGPLASLLKQLNKIQKLESKILKENPSYNPKLRVAIVTARNAPAHRRVVTTLKNSGLYANDVFFLGGIDKTLILKELKPQIFFDDQIKHLENAADSIPCVHVPFGIVNKE